MEQVRDAPRTAGESPPTLLPVSVIIPVRNEAHNLTRCLDSLQHAGEVFVVDSLSTDATSDIARCYRTQIVQFNYHGGWPKKRQWAMDTLPLAYDWILLVDADEVVTPALAAEIRGAIHESQFSGYYIKLQQFFLGRQLRFGGTGLYKLSLFRRGHGRFECRARDQDTSMCDMEVHEHVIVNGPTAKLKNPLLHHNVESLSRYIRKHDEYSNWECQVWNDKGSTPEQLPPSLLGNQAQRRRWLKNRFLAMPGSPLAYFLYKYFFQLGVLDGVPGLIYCGFQGIQFFHIKAKIYERDTKEPGSSI